MTETGQCQCGEITFSVEGEPTRMAQCHCADCRRITGTGHLVQAFFKKDQISITGAPKTHDSISDRGNTRTRHFCPTCGSRLFADNSASPDIRGIAVGAFHNSDWFKPQIIVYAAQRPVWDHDDPTIPTHDKM